MISIQPCPCFCSSFNFCIFLFLFFLVSCHGKLKPNDLHIVKVQQSSCIFVLWSREITCIIASYVHRFVYKFYENHENLYIGEKRLKNLWKESYRDDGRHMYGKKFLCCSRMTENSSKPIREYIGIKSIIWGFVLVCECVSF